jgi:hypothetical protein
VSTASAPEYQPRRVLIDVLDRLVQLDERLAAISGDRSYLCYSPTPKKWTTRATTVGHSRYVCYEDERAAG